MKNVEQTIISQYGNSSTIGQLIANMNENLDPSADIDNFYNVVWNVANANLFGLAIWSRIVGIPQSLIAQLGTYLDDADTFRSLILLKALSNISIDSAPSINQLLQNWLGGGVRAYMQDLGNMTISYVFEFPLTAIQLQIIKGSTIFLRGAGVLANIVQATFPVFGFKNMGTTWAAPFGQAPFIPGS